MTHPGPPPILPAAADSGGYYVARRVFFLPHCEWVGSGDGVTGALSRPEEFLPTWDLRESSCNPFASDGEERMERVFF